MAKRLVYKLKKNLKVYKTSTTTTHSYLITKGSVFEGTDLGRGKIRIDKIVKLAAGSSKEITTNTYVGIEKDSYKTEETSGSDVIDEIANSIKNESKEYTVKTTAVLVYGSTDNNAKSIGKLDKGTVFAAKNLGMKSDFLKIISIKSSKSFTSYSYKGKFIKKSDLSEKKVEKTSDVATTEATTDAEGNPENTTDNNSSLPDLITPEDFFLDENFALSYNPVGLMDEASYNRQVEDYKQTIESLTINDIRGVLGIPHQFLPITDVRIDATVANIKNDNKSASVGSLESIGRVYANKIIINMPLLLLTPGVPSFMSSFSKEHKSIALTSLIGGGNLDNADLDSLVNNTSGKYYILRYAYTEYFYYVNAMLRSAAVFLEIHNETINTKKLGSMNWLYWTTDPDIAETPNVDNADNDTTSTTKNTDMFGNSGLKKFLGPYSGCIAMYADCGNSVDDSFSNSTTTSQLASTLNSLSDTGRELNFLVGNAGALVNINLSKLAGQEELLKNMDTMTDLVKTALGNNGILSNILSKAQTILAGGRIVFPEIWADSSFSRSYSCKLKLVSPSGDKLSIFLNILVPIYHILALTLPRQALGGEGAGDGQAYFSPFLVRGYCKGLFNIDMGIITDLSISKGAEGEWNIDGIPTVAEVSFSIKDLYDGMFMSKSTDIGDRNILSNTTELDYIANSCGVNINDQDIQRTITMYTHLGFISGGAITDKIELGIFGKTQQFFNSKIHRIFGAFD